MAPVSANTLAKMANGVADNLLLTTYLSAKCPVFFAPAMDLDMFHHPTTEANISRLQSFGNVLIEPREGELASGLCGAGRLEEPEAMLQIIADFFKKKVSLHNKRVLISAGPTFEPIDPVRFVGNHSSGQMGYALAEQAAEMGAKVTLVSGPVNLEPRHPAIQKVQVGTAAQMAKACLDHFSKADITIMAAAVADFTVKNTQANKIKKGDLADDHFAIEMVPTQDILATMGQTKGSNQLLIGFALETDNEKANAQKKLHTKNLDVIVLNSLKDVGAGFGTPTNKVTLLFKNGMERSLPLQSKKDVASDILDEVVKLLNDLNC
jgi:phosphopantothenoylcysteine decarboxylase/phosphopantothenate--cysteine ligase